MSRAGALSRGNPFFPPVRTYFFKSKKAEVEQEEPVQLSEEEVEEAARQAEALEKSRDKSRMEPHIFRRLHQLPTDTSDIERAVAPLKALRKQFGQEGAASNVDLRMLWPSSQEMALMQEYEQVAHPLTVTELMAAARKNKEALVKVNVDEQLKIRKDMQSLDKWKKDLRNRVAAQQAKAHEAWAKRERLIEEVRQVLGVRVDPDDPQFKEALEKREADDRKAQRKLKKQEKQQKMLDAIQARADQAKPKASEPSPGSDLPPPSTEGNKS